MLVSIPFSNWHQFRLVLVGSWHPSVFYWVRFRSEEIMKFVFMSLWFLSACIPFQQKVPLKIRIQRNLLLISKLPAGGILFAIHSRQTLQVHRNLHTRLFMELLHYISDLKERTTAYNLRGTLKVDLPRVTTTSYGLQSFRYAALQVWNKLPDNIRTSKSLIAFKHAIHNITV